jgi:hypothetical protein
MSEELESVRVVPVDRQLDQRAFHGEPATAAGRWPEGEPSPLPLLDLRDQPVRGRVRVQSVLSDLGQEGRGGRHVSGVVEAVAQSFRDDRPDLRLRAGESRG